MKTGEQLKLVGIVKAAKKHAGALYAARKWAETLGQHGRQITSDDVKAMLDEWGVSDLGNAAGAIFTTEHWQCVGWKQSTRPSAHGRFIRVWRLK